ncbi:glycerol-3-phosphate 1-O-acyltransferase PlsY [Devosia psychrophila]|uniref:Glycerol-3-phosphate acyltransferase n=1 Tax=Devosia psychrophila TaxID=728005 RepID=A0A0F5Q1J6_9HYPH|nr:glycerol-3-phosphate 1-O-acyltransferase PlsY [Devosia psychrophila]KKC34735.1 glycerol-3-phosphate acyltransferase [Devosia psychrophila]SFC06300.1 glycerol-3-phosphate acyltransferase PlsY [Devosia psychrophila]
MDVNLLYAAVFAYLCGSVPFGLLLTRAAGLGDIRNIGSGNIGATNVLRTGNRWLAAATLILDAAKAALPILVARYYWGENAAMLAAIFAFLGHCFPVWLNFKGGKGVAVMIGSLLALSWPVGLIFCAVWLVIAFAQKLSSLAALTAAATAPIFAFVVVNEWLAGAVAVMALMLFFQHRANIVRLMAGTEPKIGSEKTAK